jgi:hypothetical protein
MLLLLRCTKEVATKTWAWMADEGQSTHSPSKIGIAICDLVGFPRHRHRHKSGPPLSLSIG